MINRFKEHNRIFIPLFLILSILGIEICISLAQLWRYKSDIKPYYVTPILRPLVRMFVADDFVPRTLSMYGWPWDYKTDRARPGHYTNPMDPKFPPYTINSFGLRGKEFQIPKPQGTFRVVVFGGSTTFASENTDEETYPARLEQILRKQLGRQDVEVINYSAHGKSLYWMAQQYFREAQTIEPDLVIINSIRTTFSDQLQRWTPYTDIVTPEKAKNLRIHLFLTDNLLLYRFVRRGVEKIQYNAMVHRLVKNEDDELKVYIGLTTNVLPHFFNVLYPEMIESIYLDAKKRGSRFMLIIEPIRCQPGDEKGPTCMWGKYVHKVPLYYDAFLGAIKKLQDKHPDLLVLDPVQEMIRAADQERDPYAIFIDPVHLTPKGNLRLADLISQKLFADGLITKTSQ